MYVTTSNGVFQPYEGNKRREFLTVSLTILRILSTNNEKHDKITVSLNFISTLENFHPFACDFDGLLFFFVIDL